MNLHQPYDTWFFTGAKATYTTIDAGPAVDAGFAGMDQLVTIPSTGHGFLASSGSLQSLIYIQGTTNYNGLKKIHAVAANTITIVAKYVAETFAGTETLKSMVGFNHPFELLGYEVKLSAAGGAGSLTVTLDADVGAAFDQEFDTNDMTALAKINQLWNPAKLCKANDKVDFAYANANTKTFGIKVFTRRLI